MPFSPGQAALLQNLSIARARVPEEHGVSHCHVEVGVGEVLVTIEELPVTQAALLQHTFRLRRVGVLYGYPPPPNLYASFAGIPMVPLDALSSIRRSADLDHPIREVDDIEPSAFVWMVTVRPE
ncbi:hypothetical protein ACWFR5_21320 [Streptomyces sp. NPDC055092]